MTPEERAIRCAELMWQRDQASQGLGIMLEDVGPGRAVCSLRVEQRHTNGHEICHGGFTFTLADTAFAFACNSYNKNAVAQHNAITYIKPALLGDTLHANAMEVSRAGRSGVYDIRVSNQHDETIALFRGCSRTIRGQFFEEEDNDDAGQANV